MIVLIGLGVLLGACAPATPERTVTDPKIALAEAIDKLREAKTFRLLIEQIGKEYLFGVSLDGGGSVLNASMRRGEVQYLAPNVMYGSVTLRVSPLPPVSVEIFAQGDEQWFKPSGSDWINFPIAEGFNPEQLMQEGSGFSVALAQLREVVFVGVTTLIDGTQALHIRGDAGGEVVNQLLFNLLALQSDRVLVDVYLAPDSGLPVQLTVTIPQTAGEGDADTAWNIEIYDYNAPASFTPPAGVTLPQS